MYSNSTIPQCSAEFLCDYQSNVGVGEGSQSNKCGFLGKRAGMSSSPWVTPTNVSRQGIRTPEKMAYGAALSLFDGCPKAYRKSVRLNLVEGVSWYVVLTEESPQCLVKSSPMEPVLSCCPGTSVFGRC